MNVVGERIIVFGDSLSHVGPDKGDTIVDIRGPILTSAPGGVLAQELVARGAQAARVDALVGRSARGFIGAEVDKSLLLASDRAFRPTKVIVMLGTNDIDLGLTPSALAATQAAMAQIRDTYRAMGAEVFAIGPPSFPDNPSHAQGAPIMFQAMRQVFGADHTLDMQPLTVGAARTNDGIHFQQSGAALVGPRLAQGIIALGAPVMPASTGMSTGAKVALGVLGVAGFVGLSWLALRVAKSAAQKPGLGRRELGVVDERLINRIAQALAYEVPVNEIHDQLVDEGYSEEDIYLGYKAAKMHLKHMDEPLPDWVAPDPEAAGL